MVSSLMVNFKAQESLSTQMAIFTRDNLLKVKDKVTASIDMRMETFTKESGWTISKTIPIAFLNFQPNLSTKEE